MSITIKKYDDVHEAVSFLQTLALEKEKYIYRGHSNESYKLTTTLSRHRSIPHESWSSDIDDMLDMFRAGLAKLNILPFESNNRQDWLEYARHHGVPTPVLDFSYSPFVATFFAFNGLRVTSNSTNEYVVIYALDIENLAWIWATINADIHKDDNLIQTRRQQFLYPKEDVFKNSFPGATLQFIPTPSKYNYRMHRQQGALLYDTIDYSQLKVKDLDEFIDNYKETGILDMSTGSTIPADPTLYKIYINKECMSEILSLLELMGINGGTLYLNADGVALDVVNSYYYRARTSYLRDLRFPPPEQ